MEPYRQQIEELSIEELQGTLSPDDQRLLDSLLEQYPDARAIREEVRAVFSTEAGQRALHRPEQPVEAVFEHGRRKQQQTRIRRILAVSVAAAVLLLAYVRFYPFASQPATPPTAALVMASIDPRHIKLALANGQAVDLSTDSLVVKLADVTLQNQQQTLTITKVPAGTQWATLTVPAGKDYKVNLPDGSEVWLNAATSLRFPLSFTGNTREVDITGEAYVKVAPLASKPFLVHLPGSTVNVLGTEFNVNTYRAGETRLALVQGAVNLALPGKTLPVKPGFELTVTGNKNSAKPFDRDEVLGWRDGVCVFKNTSLPELSQILNRWFGVDVVLDNPKAGKIRFDGAIRRSDNLEEFMTNLQFTGGPQFYIKDKVLHLK